jgi:hypothetical protein
VRFFTFIGVEEAAEPPVAQSGINAAQFGLDLAASVIEFASLCNKPLA